MKTIKELLRDADPLLHEQMIFSEELDRQRKTILAAASRAHDNAKAKPLFRATVLVALAFVLIVALFFAQRISSPLVGNVYAAAVRFEVKLGEEKPAAGLREAQISGTDRFVYLYPESVVTNSDISRAYITQTADSSQYSVGVDFTPSGAEKIGVATAGHINKPVAILLNGQVVMTATVRAPIGKAAVISGGISRSEAEKIVKGIMVTR